MVQTLEATKGGADLIKVGTIGIISSLMTRELEYASSTSLAPSSSSYSSQTVSISSSKDEASSSGIKYRSPETIQKTRGKNQHQIRIYRATMPKRHKRRMSPVEESGRGGSKNIPSLSNERSPDWKTKSYKGTQQIPMLGFENIALDKTPNREMPSKKRYNVVNVVDINCGSSSGSLANRLKKLGFSKLSQSFG